MDFEYLSNKKIILFGKSRALSHDEFNKQLQNHSIILVDDVSEGVERIFEGRLINPVKQDELDQLYADNVAPIVAVDELEQWLCQAIDADTLLMSLKLSSDRERLIGYLQNKYITNALFLRLLKLYNWEGLGFFESDENRDITAALISRFYENIERNHNVQYANMGIMHLLNQSNDSTLTETIALLPPLQTALKDGCDNSTLKILHAVARHPHSSKRVLKQWLKNGNDDIKMLIAMRYDLDLQLQQYLLNLSQNIIDETLSLNDTIAPSIALTLLERYPENILKHIALGESLFNAHMKQYAVDLAENPSLSLAMQEQLLTCDSKVQSVLAQNSHLCASVFETLFNRSHVDVLAELITNEQITPSHIEKLYQRQNATLNLAIASSQNTDITILQALAKSSDTAILLALAKNPSTPIDLLYQFQLDSQLARAVKENPSFGTHIQRDNIGWDV